MPLEGLATGLERGVAIPYDPELRRMLDAGAYHPAQLPHATRVAVLQLGASIAEKLQ